MVTCQPNLLFLVVDKQQIVFTLFPTMARNVVTRSISFEPDLFQFMEERRLALRMQRSEYLNRLVVADAKLRGDMVIPTNVDTTPEVAHRVRKTKK